MFKYKDVNVFSNELMKAHDARGVCGLDVTCNFLIKAENIDI